MLFPKPGKYSIINKSTIFAPFYCPYLSNQVFTSSLHDLKNENHEDFFRKTGKITYLP